jgi:PTH1 family peptidyl-tRNA hydrolase
VWAVVGLGNPGRRYADSRHNVGFMLIREVADAWGVSVRKARFLSKTAEVRRDGERVVLALPQTFMNASGEAVGELVRGLRLDPERLVVAFDDIDLPLGEIRIRKDGGPGTHKGMASIVQGLGTERFPRIRIGIRPESESGDIVRFVLSPFRRSEREALAGSLSRARDALDLIIAGRIEAAMNRYNGASRAS